jgi:ATP-dependent RNA helicase DeaD
MKVPTVKSVMKAIRSRIVAAVTAVLPEPEIPAPLPGPETAALSPGSEAVSTELPPDVPPVLPPEPDTAAAVLPAPVVSGGPGAGSLGTILPVPAEPPDADSASPFLAKVCRQLIERLGADRAVEALITLAYGELLDPSRYGPVTEFSGEDFHEFRKERVRPGHGGLRHVPGRAVHAHSHGGIRGHGRGAPREDTGDRPISRVYVGLGRLHGASARDVAQILTRAGGVPGRMVDEIEMKDYCSFATLPADAARRACSFSRGDSRDPVIRPAH